MEARDMLVSCGAILEGHFVLKSGKHSGVYVNKDVVFTRPHVLSALCKQIAWAIPLGRVDVVAGPTVGAVAMASWTAYHLDAKYHDSGTWANPVLSVYVDEADGKRVLKRGFDNAVKGKNVLMVEDVLTTGTSLMEATQAVGNAGGVVVGAASLFNRRPGQNTGEAILLPTGAAQYSAGIFSLVEEEVQDYPDWEHCPLCGGDPLEPKVPISLDIGHGRQYLGELKALTGLSRQKGRKDTR